MDRAIDDLIPGDEDLDLDDDPGARYVYVNTEDSSNYMLDDVDDIDVDVDVEIELAESLDNDCIKTSRLKTPAGASDLTALADFFGSRGHEFGFHGVSMELILSRKIMDNCLQSFQSEFFSLLDTDRIRKSALTLDFCKSDEVFLLKAVLPYRNTNTNTSDQDYVKYLSQGCAAIGNLQADCAREWGFSAAEIQLAPSLTTAMRATFDQARKVSIASDSVTSKRINVQDALCAALRASRQLKRIDQTLSTLVTPGVEHETVDTIVKNMRNQLLEQRGTIAPMIEHGFAQYAAGKAALNGAAPMDAWNRITKDSAQRTK